MTDTQVVEDTSPVQDTEVTQQNEASVQTKETPEATQGQTVEETTQTGVNAEDTVEKLYAGKYKSPEEMEKGYKELESKFGQTTSEKAELSRILNEAFTTPEPVQPVATEDFDDEPNPLSQEISNLKRSQAVSTFVMLHPDADSASMKEVLDTDPFIGQITGHEAKLEYAYLKSQNIATPKAIAEATKKAAQDTQTKIVEKQTAQVETAKSAEKIDEKTELMSKMSQGSVEERAAARRQYIRKYMV